MNKDDAETKETNILEELIGGIRSVKEADGEDKLMEKVDTLKESEKNVDNLASTKPEGDASKAKAGMFQKNPVGVDIGTSRIVGVKTGDSGTIGAQIQLNAFFTLPYSKLAEEMLIKNEMKFIKLGDKNLAVIGHDAAEFANIFNGEVRRPMHLGLLKSDESQAIPIIKAIIGLVVSKPKEMGDSLCFSVPAPQVGCESDLLFHESILKKYFVGQGFNARAITEGTAIVLSELSQDNFTGIGISMGAGLCNVCFSFLSVPIIVFSVPRGGDSIDLAVSRVVSQTVNRVRVIKEESLDLARPPKNNLENAFHIYYEDLISNLLNNFLAILSQASGLPKLKSPIPILLAGGTCMPNGFKIMFDKVLKHANIPIAISEVRIASDPLRATARGCLINAAGMSK